VGRTRSLHAFWDNGAGVFACFVRAPVAVPARTGARSGPKYRKRLPARIVP
jgi:hypothetical protein